MIPLQVFEFLKSAVNEFGTLRQVILFGSFATGEYDDRSDVDLLLVFDEEDPEAKYLSKAISLGNRAIDGLPEGEQSWEFSFVITDSLGDIDPAMKRAIIEDGIVLYGRPLPMNLERRNLYSYTLSGKTRSEMVRFNRALDLAGLKVKKRKNVIIASESGGETLEEIFKSFGVKYKKKLIFQGV